MTTFDEHISRKGTDSVKWDSIAATYNEQDLLPMWVADMDFLSPEPVRAAFSSLINEHPLGYAEFPESLYTAIRNWQETRNRYTVETTDILFSSGVVPSIVLALQSYTQEGDAVLINDPVYPPFANCTVANKRKLVRSPLIKRNNHFEFDLQDMEARMIEEEVKLFILCNPHNPGGRVWTKDELAAVGELCCKHSVLVISDEIHQDLVFAPNSFTTFHNAGEGFDQFSIILTAATKTFNLAGIKNSMVFIKEPGLRKAFVAVQERNQQHEINTFGLVGTEAAYNFGSPWLSELLPYLQENVRTVLDFFKEVFPKVDVMVPEGTYLIWIDFSSLGLSNKELQDRFIHKGKILMNAGYTFGPAGNGHARMNVACPNATVKEGLQRIRLALEDLI